MRGRELFLYAQPILRFLSRAIGLLPNRWQVWVLRALRPRGGLAGIGLRYSALNALGVARESNVSVREDVYLLNPHGLKIGRNVSIHPLCYIDAAGGVDIGDDVSIAHGVSIMSTSHEFSDLKIPIKDQGVASRPTRIESGCWIGAQTVILGGVTIGRGAIVGAGAVVTHDVRADTVVGGVPAQEIKRRTS